MITSIESFDFKILDYIQGAFKCPFLDRVMPVITHLGSLGILWIIITVIMLFTKKYRKTGVTSGIALLLSLLICNLLIKPAVARIRPYEINTLITLLVEPLSDYSFPSGHTTAAFAASVAVLLRKKRVIGIPMLIISVLIAFSRLYLYVHFPSDVFFGMLLGITFAITAYFITNSVYKRYIE